MKSLMFFCIAVLCVCVAFGALYVADRAGAALDSVTAAVNDVPGIVEHGIDDVRNQLTGRIDYGIDTARDEIRATRGEASRQLKLTRLAAVAEIEGLHESADFATFAALKLADYHAGQIEKRLDTSNLVLAQTAAPLRDTVRQIADAAPLFLDCDHNENCLFNRYVGTAHGIEQAAIAVGRAAPILTADAEQIAGHVAHIADEAQRFTDKTVEPRTKKQIALQVLISASMIGSRLF